jgi:hypothetical protein
MACDSARRCFFAVILWCGVLATPAAGGEQLVVAGVLGDSSIVAPLLRMATQREDGSRWTMSLEGSTIAGGWERPLDGRRRLFAAVDLTPLYAHASNRIYRDGVRDRQAEFDDSAFELRAGLGSEPSEGWSWRLGAVALYEALGKASDPSLETRWRDPYGGALWELTYERVRAEDVLRARLEGWRLVCAGRVLLGDETFFQQRAVLGWGRRPGRLYLGQSAALFAGGSLDTVNAFLLGGSWDTGGAGTLYGYRYAELRIERGAVLNLRADLTLGEGSSLGVRASMLEGSKQSGYGFGVNAERIWHGVVLTGGGFFPGRRSRTGHRDVIFAVSIAAAAFGS